MRAFSFVLMVVALGVSGCSKSSPTSPSQVNVPFATLDLVVGTGAEATTGRSVTVNYTVWLYDAAGTNNKGSLVDSSLAPGRAPYPFTIGTNSTIAGFSQGTLGMKVGGLRRVTVPPNLAYGAQGSPPAIPPNATLIFEIELLAVQ
jgi:FKBP-type peptidyl-prolyl cis-trans isomerase FkpA